MAMLRRLSLFFITCVLLACNTTPGQYPLEDYRFVDIFGQRRDDTTGAIYALQCSGWHTARYRSDSMVLVWTTLHPDAKVQEVCSFRSADPVTGKELKTIYCWLVSDVDTLNTWLVRSGCCNAAAMLWPDGFNKFITPGYDKQQRVETKVNINEKTYKTFCGQLRSAEAWAQVHKAGIWSLPDSLR